MRKHLPNYLLYTIFFHPRIAIGLLVHAIDADNYIYAYGYYVASHLVDVC